MRVQLAVVFVVSCGGGHAVQQPVLANKPPVAPSCKDAGVVLRGRVDDETTGEKRETAITNICEVDHWSAEVLRCVASSAHPDTCLAKLTRSQHLSLDDKLDNWSDASGDGNGDVGGVVGGDIGGVVAPPPPPPPQCSDILANVDEYPPADPPAALKDLDLEWYITLRKHAVERVCNDESWPVATLVCIQAATNRAAIQGCLADKYDKRLLTEILDAHKLAEKTEAARRKPATIGCKQVVAAHYADAMWKGKLDPKLKPAERKRMITGSRDAMLKVCTAEHWSESVRACLIAGGEDTCFEGAGLAIGQWGYPFDVGFPSLGIPECDAYGAEIVKLSHCATIPESAREALANAYRSASASWADLPPESRSAVADACKAGADAVRQSIAATCP